jgi:hypothetical protein
MTVNPAKFYSSNPATLEAKSETKLITGKEVQKQIALSDKAEVKKTHREDFKVDISEQSKELKEKLSSAQKAHKIHSKKFGNVEKPGIYFVSGFDWLGVGSIKGNYNGISDMAEAVDGAKLYSWDEQDEIIDDIKKRKSDQPIVLVGHSFGGDGIVEIANRLNTIDNGFRKIDLMVTLDSVGTDNDLIPQNVKKNLNYLAQGPYDFLNDGPNIARNYERTKVENFLRHEEHAELDDATDIQIVVLEEIDKLLS